MGDEKPGRGPDLRGLRRLSSAARPPKRERDLYLPRILAFTVAAALAIAVPWFVITRIGDRGPIRPGAGGGRPAPSSPSSPSPTGAAAEAGVYEVVGDVRCARIRVAPGTDQEIVNCITPGVKLRSDGRMEEQDGFIWLHVEDPFKKIDGWIATRYVRRVT